MIPISNCPMAMIPLAGTVLRLLHVICILQSKTRKKDPREKDFYLEI
jgi:hypothetical protein